MEEGQQTSPEAAVAPTILPPKPLSENAVLKFVQRPRILLILLVVWEIIGVLTEFFTSSGIFLDLKGGELDGALAGRSLSWESIPLAALYAYCARSPERFQPVFYVALIEQVSAIVANVYHWGAGDFSGESILIPVIVAAALGALVFLHLFQPKPEQAPTAEEGAPG